MQKSATSNMREMKRTLGNRLMLYMRASDLMCFRIGILAAGEVRRLDAQRAQAPGMTPRRPKGPRPPQSEKKNVKQNSGPKNRGL